MKTILHIAEAFGSGVLNYVKNLSLWQSKDYKVVIAYGIRPETPETIAEQFPDTVTFIKVDGFTREISPKDDIKAFRHIRRIVQEVKPDLIHLHSTKAGILGRWAIDCNKYQVLYSPHAYSFLMMNCSETKRNIYFVCEKISNKKRCLTITDVDGELEASRGVTQNAVCIPNGINPKEMDEVIKKAQQYRTANEKFTVCTLGKAVPQKNPQMFNEIAKEFPQIDFLWIGDGELRHKLTSPNITVTGWLTRPEAVAKVIESDVFFFPSKWESLSIALLEVMYLGKPCVVSTADGNRDVIHTGMNGYVCTTKEEYVSAIENLYQNEMERARFGAQVREDILNKYNVYEMEKTYKKLFGKIGINTRGGV